MLLTSTIRLSSEIWTDDWKSMGGESIKTEHEIILSSKKTNKDYPVANLEEASYDTQLE